MIRVIHLGFDGGCTNSAVHKGVMGAYNEKHLARKFLQYFPIYVVRG